jgi:hypothetical protein
VPCTFFAGDLLCKQFVHWNANPHSFQIAQHIRAAVSTATSPNRLGAATGIRGTESCAARGDVWHLLGVTLLKPDAVVDWWVTTVSLQDGQHDSLGPVTCAPLFLGGTLQQNGQPRSAGWVLACALELRCAARSGQRHLSLAVFIQASPRAPITEAMEWS